MLEVVRTTRRLVFTRPGELLPWMGPALRGLLGWRFKADVCRHPRQEWLTTWKYCAGCPQMVQCPFGQTLEPDPPPGAVRFKGQEKASRPIVLAMPFPMPVRVHAGTVSSVTIGLIGTSAIAQEASVWQALIAAGADPDAGFDPHRTTFQVEPAPVERTHETISLPPDLDPRPAVHQVRIDLTSPLILHTAESSGKHRRVVLKPSFADLLRSCLRVLGGLFSLYDKALPAEFAHLKETAGEVPTLRSDYVPFDQGHHSSRSRQTRKLVGVLGSAVYGPVPAALVDWLGWGGRVHAGTDRVAGAGGWRVEVPDGRGWTSWQPEFHEERQGLTLLPEGRKMSNG